MNTQAHPQSKTLTRNNPGILASVALTLTLTALTSGCQIPSSTQPLGTSPVPTSNLALDGIWRSADGEPFHVRTLDANAGHLEFAHVATQDSGFRLERHEVLLRRHNEVILANLRTVAPDPENHFYFGRLTLQDHSIILTFAAPNPLRTLALQGAFEATITTNRQGTTETYDVQVTGGFDKLADLLTAPDGWRWLDTENPLVLTRQK